MLESGGYNFKRQKRLDVSCASKNVKEITNHRISEISGIR